MGAGSWTRERERAGSAALSAEEGVRVVTEPPAASAGGDCRATAADRAAVELFGFWVPAPGGAVGAVLLSAEGFAPCASLATWLPAAPRGAAGAAPVCETPPGGDARGVTARPVPGVLAG